MRILLVANYEPDGQQSMQHYAEWLARALKARGHAVVIIHPHPILTRLLSAKLEQSTLKKYLAYIDKFLLFPPTLSRRAHDFDLVHILDHSNSMYLRAVGDKPKLITCHDLLAVRAAMGEFPIAGTGWSGRILQRWILSGLRSATNIVCVSEKTASDLLVLSTKSKTDKHIRVIFNALNFHYQSSAVKPTFKELPEPHQTELRNGAPYFFHVGGNQWYKNRLGVLKIFAELRKLPAYANTRLLLAGKPWTRPMRDFVHANNLFDTALEVGPLSSESLQALYSHAIALLFPSLEEGFGWPIIEAQACTCPVITTNRAPMSEVAGAGPGFDQQAAILIDPADPIAAARIINEQLTDREAIIRAGIQNLTRFNEQCILDQYCDFYTQILTLKN